MKRHFELEASLRESPNPLTAPPDWTHAEVATVNDAVVLHAGGGRLQGEWHRQDSDEVLVVLRGELRVDFDDEHISVGPGQGVFIRAHERHRTEVPEDALLLSVEATHMQRLEP
ncbi:MAG: cupin domain-containing protein [Rubrobacteraceae bacterium]